MNTEIKNIFPLNPLFHLHYLFSSKVEKERKEKGKERKGEGEGEGKKKKHRL